MREIEYVKPQTITEALSLLAEKGTVGSPLAGGTDMITMIRVQKRDADRLVDIKGIPELNDLSYDSQKGLTLGAAVPCYRIYENQEVAKAYPGLIDAASLIGGIQIQDRASVGGNLCNAAPSADAIPPLIALEATCVIAGSNGTREVPVEDFCTAPGETVLGNGELLVSLKMPPPKKNSGAHYLRFIPRNEMDIAVAGSGVSVVLSDDHKSFVSARVALASVAPTPLFVREAGEYLAGKEVSDETIERAAEIASEAARPITDMRGTIEQRKHLCKVLTRRALKGAIQRAKEA